MLTCHQGTNTLALFPTKIQSEYCTNPAWLRQAIDNEALFYVTLYVSSIHIDGLHGRKESSESLYYKNETIRVLSGMMRDPKLATADETISAVLLLGNVLVQLSLPLSTILTRFLILFFYIRVSSEREMKSRRTSMASRRW
jgi:hypothetical protein